MSIRKVRIIRDQVERFVPQGRWSTGRSYRFRWAAARRIVDLKGVDVIQPWFTGRLQRRDALECCKQMGYEIVSKE